MRKIPYKTLIILLFTALQYTAAAHGPADDIIKEKTVSKVYLVNPDAGVDISNKYGSIYVTTWNENKIGIDVVIKVRGRNEEAVNKRLAGINVELNPLKHLVSARTVIGSFSGGRTSIEINYTVRIPKNGSIRLNNHYGPIVVDKIRGKSDIECRYGSVTIAELHEESNLLDIRYCDKSTITYIRNGTIDAKYSKLQITKAGNLTYDSDYSDLKINEVGNLRYNSNYGDLNVATANSIEGNGNYMAFRFGSLHKNLSINTTYSSIRIGSIAADAGNLNISSDYTNIDIGYNPRYAFNFDFSLKYAELQAAGLQFEVRKDSGTSKYYKGFYKTDGANTMTINNSYGNVKLTRL